MSAIIYGPFLSQVLFLLIAVFSLAEFYKLFNNTSANPNTTMGLVAGCLCYIVLTGISAGILQSKWIYLLMPALCILFIAELFRKKEQPFLNIAYSLTGIVYTVIPLSLLNFIPLIDDQYHYKILLGYFFLLWTYDTFAYVFGVLLGKHRMFERISPKKSWEGGIGGLISTIAMAFLLSRFFTELTSINWMVIAIIIAVTGTLGDLTESMLKRSLNIKDTGTILPGHGGLLDRFDALFLSVPFVLMYLMLR